MLRAPLRQIRILLPLFACFEGSLCYSNRVNHPFRPGLPGSGQGYNVVAMAEACAAGKVPAQAALVLRDVEGAGILGQASEMSF